MTNLIRIKGKGGGGVRLTFKISEFPPNSKDLERMRCGVLVVGQELQIAQQATTDLFKRTASCNFAHSQEDAYLATFLI